MNSDHVWENENEYCEYQRVKKMNPAQMLEEFHTVFNSPRDKDWDTEKTLEKLATLLIKEECKEFLEEEKPEKILKELADIIYVAYGYADRFGWDLNEAVRRVHLSNLSKLDENKQPIFREDGKVLKGPNYKEPDLKDLV